MQIHPRIVQRNVTNDRDERLAIGFGVFLARGVSARCASPQTESDDEPS